MKTKIKIKMKTHRGAAKRFRRTASGRIKRSNAYAGHILTKKTRKRKRRLRKSSLISKSDMARIDVLLPR